ncbi:MAG: tetratricopeptide repeat protein, partial [Myxococcales bacterium]|nr:tetratricopeptide repeat protein [Myxococcales bacterium]
VKTLEIQKRVLGEEHPSTLSTMNNLAILYEDQGRYDEAEPLYLKTLEIRKRVLGEEHPSTLSSMNNLAILYWSQGRYAEAAEDFRTARRIEPNSARWVLGHGRAVGKLHDPGKVVPIMRRALMLDPEDPTIHAQLGLALLEAGAVDAAIQSLRAALKRRPELERKVGRSGVAIVHGHIGAALARKGQAGEALAQFDTSLRIDPENGAVYRERGILLDREGRETEAITSYREALVHGDRSAPLLNNLAWLLVSAHEPGVRAPAEAVRLAEEAVQLTDRQEPSILDTLSVALAAAGRPQARKVALEAMALAEARGDVALARSIRDRIESAPGG